MTKEQQEYYDYIQELRKDPNFKVPKLWTEFGLTDAEAAFVLGKINLESLDAFREKVESEIIDSLNSDDIIYISES